MKKTISYPELEKKIRFLEQENKQLKKFKFKYQNSQSDKLKSPDINPRQESNSLQSYYEIFNSTSELIFIFDFDSGKIIDLNQAVIETLGYKYDEILQLDINNLIVSETTDHIENVLSVIQEIANGKNQNFNGQVIRKDGSAVSLEITLKRTKIDGTSRILAVARSIPEIKKSEIALQQAADIFNNIQTGIHIYELENLNDDRTLRMIAANPATEKLTGVPVGEIIGKTLDENFPGLRKKGIPQKYAEVVREKNAYELEDINYSDERVVAGAFALKAFPLPNNRVGVSFENITEKKQAEEELHNSTKYLKGIINASPSVIYTYNFHKNKVTYVSDKIKDLTGYTPEEIDNLENVLTEFVHQDDLPLLAKYLKDMQQSLIEEISDFEFRIIKKNGNIIWISFLAIIFERDENNVPVQLIGTISEITNKKEAELALKKNEENYRLIVEGQSDMIIKFDTNGIILFVSPSYCDKFGMAEEELIGTKYQPLIHDDDRLKTTSLNEDLKNPPYISYVEQRVMTKDGWRWMAWTLKALLDEKGKIREIIGVGSDITDRKIAENALIESEERYRTLFEQAADGILVGNSEGYIIDVNKNMTKITGYKKEDLLGNKIDILFDESDLVLKPIRYDQLRSGITVITEHKIIRKDRTIIDVEMNAKQLADGRLQALLRDITVRKKSEKALKESEQKYRLLFETATDAIFMMSKDIFVDCNSATLKIYGCKREEIIGQTPFRFSPETQPDGKNSKVIALKKINNALNIGPQFFEWQHIKYDGTPFDAEVSLKKIEFSDSVYLQAIVRDITARKAAENALRERESQLAETNQMLELILNTIPVRVFWKDKDFKFLGCNKLFAADAGYDDPKSLIGKTDYDLIWKEQADLYRSDDMKVISSSDPIMNIEEPQTTPDGHVIWLKTNKIQLRNIQNETIGILGTYEDITERKQIEKKILDAIIVTEEREREKFAKNLHDDLGPLLSSIKMYVNSILNANSVEKQQFIVKQLNEIAKEAIQSTKEISNDLSPHVLRNYGLLSAIESFARKVEDYIEIFIDTNLSDDRFSEEIETSLYRIIKELINNTIKHANASFINIYLIKKAEEIHLIFKDDGIGFDPKANEDNMSAGMGLSNIISRIRSLKGNYSLNSDASKGVEFKLVIPVAK
jgi:PAS domain S-box-containing protein